MSRKCSKERDFFAMLCGLFTARGGSVALQFALVAAPFMALLIATAQSALILFAQEVLLTATEKASRQIVTGQTQAADAASAQTGMTPAQMQERFRRSVCASLPALFSCPLLMVDVQSAPAFAQMQTGQPTISFKPDGSVANTWSYNTGGGGSIVMVRLMYIWPVPTGPMGINFATLSNGRRLLMATEVAKSEAFS